MLAAVCKRTPGFVAVQTLCTEETGKKYQFNVANNGGMSSSILAPANHLHIFEHIQFQQTLDVFSNRLDDVIFFLEGAGYTHITDNLDTLYMDTQGAELHVLMGAGKILNRIRYIFTEVTRNDLYIGAPSMQDLLHYMDLHGFTLNNVYFNRNQYGDALFIRKDLLNPLR